LAAFITITFGFRFSVHTGAKRLHDRDKSAWWLLPFYVAPAVLIGFGLDLSMNPFEASVETASVFGAFALAIWAFVELGCLRGTAGTNRYGPDPLPLRA
jgi:uncharacterized membrane protein YhaH (DUF805 family)